MTNLYASNSGDSEIGGYSGIVIISVCSTRSPDSIFPPRFCHFPGKISSEAFRFTRRYVFLTFITAITETSWRFDIFSYRTVSFMSIQVFCLNAIYYYL